MAERRRHPKAERSTDDDVDADLVEAVEEVVEYRVRTRRGEAHPAPHGDLAWLSGAVDDGLAHAEEPGSEAHGDEAA